jgi:hypothetical protein
MALIFVKVMLGPFSLSLLEDETTQRRRPASVMIHSHSAVISRSKDYDEMRTSKVVVVQKGDDSAGHAARWHRQ